MISRSAFRKIFQEDAFSFLSVTILVMFLSLGSAMVISMLAPISGSGTAEGTLSQMIKIQSAITVYKSQNGNAAPNTLDNLISTTGTPCAPDTNTSSGTYRSLRGWCGPYLTNDFNNSTQFKQDAWGTQFQYDKINLKSCGQNLACGDSDDISLPI